ncbi:MAG: o-succinylbenzoate synthase [Bacteroidales bacterium]|nr:o-succinylbenzoate synthase [Bacteroidales bacterium]
MLKAIWTKYTLRFLRQSRTSREVLNVKDTYFIKIYDTENPAVAGYGEAGLFRGLSADDTPDFTDILDRCCKSINDCRSINDIDVASVPSSAIRMGLETALSDLGGGGLHQPFFAGVIPPTRINGLIWMGNKEFMLNEIEHKLQQGFTCLKLKIGGIDFDSELDILRSIRDRYNPEDLTLRLDANGAFTPKNALARLERLAAFTIHSIEQPIKAGQHEAMARICRESPIPIALDEELIGLRSVEEKARLIDNLRPAYLILKPTLCGGFAESDEWVRLANEKGIGWWATSALESNVGLNAIARWTASHAVELPQGLGTGQLYTNNIDSPLELRGEYITSKPDNAWNFNNIQF